MTTPCEDGTKTPARKKPARKRGQLSAKDLKVRAERMSGLAMTTLGQIMKGPGQDSVKLAAAREVLDRAHGKPKPGPKPKAAPKPIAKDGMTVIVKRFTDITPEEQAAADATEREEW